MEALEVFRSRPNHFDLVITDYAMPQMTGVELARELVAIRPDIPIILCTGYSEVIGPEEAGIIGIREYAQKPLSVHQMAIAVRKAIEWKPHADAARDVVPPA